MPDEPNLNSPFMTWETLPKEMRQEVVRLAQAGRAHPDERVRRFAWEWARGTATRATWAIVIEAAFSSVRTSVPTLCL